MNETRDFAGNTLNEGDFVATAQGNLQVLGIIWRLAPAPGGRVTIELLQWYKPEHDRNLPYEVRIQTVCSALRCVRINGELVEKEAQIALTEAYTERNQNLKDHESRSPLAC